MAIEHATWGVPTIINRVCKPSKEGSNLKSSPLLNRYHAQVHPSLDINFDLALFSLFCTRHVARSAYLFDVDGGVEGSGFEIGFNPNVERGTDVED